MDTKNILWIGRSCGLWKIENGTSTVGGEADGMTDVWKNYIYDGRHGSLWIASPSNGLLHYKNERFTAYNTKIGLFTNEIYCVLGDDHGNLWLSSSRGIGRVQRSELEEYAEGKIKTISSQVYTVEDGMKTGECFGQWQPAGWKAHDGSLWFATRKGAVRIDPKTFQRNGLPLPVLIENVVADQETVTGNQHITLTPGKDKLEFHYTALSFVVPERVLFMYKLEGYDRDWVNAGTRRVAYYTNLSPGE